jgi:hypothetical protein
MPAVHSNCNGAAPKTRSGSRVAYIVAAKLMTLLGKSSACQTSPRAIHREFLFGCSGNNPTSRCAISGFMRNKIRSVLGW